MGKENFESTKIISRDYFRPYQLFDPDGTPRKSYNPDGTFEDSIGYYNKIQAIVARGLGYVLKPVLDPHRKVKKIETANNLNINCEICEDSTSDIKGVECVKANRIVIYKDEGKQLKDDGRRYVCKDHANEKEESFWWNKD